MSRMSSSITSCHIQVPILVPLLKMMMNLMSGVTIAMWLLVDVMSTTTYVLEQSFDHGQTFLHRGSIDLDLTQQPRVGQLVKKNDDDPKAEQKALEVCLEG